MKHIETKCAEEKAARKKFAEVKPGVAIADERLEATVRELLALRHKMDDDELAASKLKAVIMAAMGNSSELKNKDGLLLATWAEGSRKKEIDYAWIFKRYKVTDEDIASATTFKATSRKFEIEEI